MRYQIAHYIYAILLLPLQIIHKGQGDTTINQLPLWTWECVNERCVPSRATTLLKLQSLQTCTMICSGVQLWPQPTGPVSVSNIPVPVRSELFHLEMVQTPSPQVETLLQEAFELFREDLHNIEKEANGFAEWRAVAVFISINGSDDPRLRLDTDESYTLLVHPKFGTEGPITIKISAKSFCGARHALESLMQLVWLDPYVGTLIMLEAAQIVDGPRFHYRGILLDTARNFFPPQDLIRTIDAMAACKLNTFHWRISDWHSFPLKLSSVPQLTKYGSYGSNAMYSTDDVRKIVRRAKIRGIRVLIEISTPGHVGAAWSFGPSSGFDDLIQCDDIDEWSNYCSEPPCGQLNPQNSHVYNILEAIYAEIINLTDVDDLFHLGSDDVSADCWRQYHSNPKRMLVQYLHNALDKLENANGKLPNLTLMWNSPWSDTMKIDLRRFIGSIGLQVRWPDITAGAQKYVSGIKTVLSQASPWSLNSGLGEWFDGPSGMPFNSWQRIYEYRPWTRGSGIALDYVLGGEVTAWASQLSTGGLDSRLWPRAAAFAERIWSDRLEGATRNVHLRLDVQRARLIARGVHPAPLWSMYCTHHPHVCG